MGMDTVTIVEKVHDATVMKIVTRKIRFDKGKEDARFLLKYGQKDLYDLICLWVKYPNDPGLYMISPLGCIKQ